jgi:uncharacterized protein YicC (UPF0701 family)
MVAQKLNIPFKPDANLLINLSNIRSNVRVSLPSLDVCEKEIISAFDSAIKHLIKMRETEGKVLAQDLKSRLSKINQMVDSIQLFRKASTASTAGFTP